MLLLIILNVVAFSITTYSIIHYTDTLIVVCVALIASLLYAVYPIACTWSDKAHYNEGIRQSLFIFGTFALFNICVELLDYVLTGSLVYPEWDTVFTRWDAYIGFNWLAYYAFVTQHIWIHSILRNAYNMCAWQGILMLIVLPLIGHANTGRVLLLRYMMTALITMTIGVFMPAVGAFAYYHLPIASKIGYIAVMRGLRMGNHVINLNCVQGLVVFPSFHAALATMCILASWRIAYVRWMFILLNGCVILSAPVEGGHYGVDVIAGILLTLMVAYVIKPKNYSPVTYVHSTASRTG